MPTSIRATDRDLADLTPLCSCEGRSLGRKSASGSWPSVPAFAGARSPDGSPGFTLLEMLVALAIFSLAGLAIVRLQAVSARSAYDLNQRTMAEIVARNLMVERMTDPKPPTFGSETGTETNFGREWTWRQGTAPLQDRRLAAITIRVDTGPGQSPAVLSFVRPAK